MIIDGSNDILPRIGDDSGAQKTLPEAAPLLKST